MRLANCGSHAPSIAASLRQRGVAVELTSKRVQIWLKGPTTTDSVSHLVALDELVGALLTQLEPEPGAYRVLRVGRSLDRACSWAAQGVRAGDTLGLVGKLDGGGPRRRASGGAGSSGDATPPLARVTQPLVELPAELHDAIVARVPSGDLLPTALACLALRAPCVARA